MPSDVLTLKVLAKELNTLLTGGKIQKVTQPEKDEVRFLVRNDANYTLVISANPNAPRIHVTDDKKDNPYTAPAFCMLLRKRLVGATVTSVETYCDDRIVKIGLIGKTEMQDVAAYNLFVELMGRYSNVILADENGKIIDSLVHIGFEAEAKRVIMPNVTYLPPDKGGKCELYDASGIENRLVGYDGDLYDFLLKNVNGLSKQSAKEIAFRAGGDKQKLQSEITFFNEIFEKNALKPCTTADYADFFVTPYETINGGDNYVFFPTLNGAVNASFSLADKKVRTVASTKDILYAAKHHRDKLLKKISIAEVKAKECADMESIRINAELLTANIYKVKRGDKAVTVDNYYDEMRPITINLDVTKSPQQNAAGLYNKYNKLKRAREITATQLIDYARELHYVESIIDELARADLSDIDDIKEELINLKIIKKQSGNRRDKQPKKSATKTFEAEGFKIYVGTNNVLNNEVTFKIGRSYDIWLHVKNHHGSHVIIAKNDENDEISQSVLLLAAETAAYFSEAAGSDNVAVDYTERRNVRRIKEAGLGMVNYDNYKTLYVTPKNNVK